MRSAFELWVNTERPSLHAAVRTYDESMALAHVMDAAWLAWQTAAAAEREACAKVCANIAMYRTLCAVDSFEAAEAAEACEDAILARSKT